jgi:hypothetical protein
MLIVVALAGALLHRDHTGAMDRARTLVTRVANSSEAEVNRNLLVWT